MKQNADAYVDSNVQNVNHLQKSNHSAALILTLITMINDNSTPYLFLQASHRLRVYVQVLFTQQGLELY